MGKMYYFGLMSLPMLHFGLLPLFGAF
jgi:hypothetical protein